MTVENLAISFATAHGRVDAVKGVTFAVERGEALGIVGESGSGKSVVCRAVLQLLAANASVTSGRILHEGQDVLAMTVDERARAGLFLAMQYPIEVPGVSVANFLRTAKTALSGEAPKVRTWVKDVNAALERVGLDGSFAARSLNEGFSGGEKKRNEIAQLELLNPKFAILDETDSGLDIDALRIVSEGVNRYTAQGDRGLLLITHYTRILNYIKPDFVHVFVDGHVVEEGGVELADRLEIEGYDRFVRSAAKVDA